MGYKPGRMSRIRLLHETLTGMGARLLPLFFFSFLPAVIKGGLFF
jgi:hypothetical protein